MATTASASLRDSDSRSLQVLLEAFGSRFSLEDIDTAFCQANRNVNKAGEILFAMTEKMPKSDELNVSEAILDPTSRNVPQEVHQEDMKSRVSKPKKYSASVGTVSSVIGKEYVSTRTLANAPRKATKPLKIDAKDIPETEIWSEEMPENSKGNSDRSQTDVEEFLIKMLREGFQVNPSVVHEVLGSCGYDVHKSMEKLLDLSDIKKHNNGGIATGMRPEEKPKKQGSNSCHNVEMQDSALSDAASNLTSPLKGSKVKTDLQREVLEALFSGAQSFEEEAEEIRRVGERRARAVGRPVAKPLVLDEPNHKRVVVVKQLPQTLKEGEDHDGFEALRKAATEYWNVMKEYYKAAVEAFLKGETERSYRLLEEGHSFKQKAREADEKSVAKLVEGRQRTNLRGG
ncbi:PREDICTED: putative nuclear RNA export factor SDE5 isoform X2 [Tarenaya hassleriana]|uniref:putative nuclear RNA export factor SDE5 isoform X2 n=1 Tax=Tarenaya hassleriana TaxID=28532 RepID=UPI00053C318E|nr:PREDICTED: putative nuclear RNA export factor SDE5 isoform X2 [Tarenaya hassleriana]